MTENLVVGKQSGSSASARPRAEEVVIGRRAPPMAVTLVAGACRRPSVTLRAGARSNWRDGRRREDAGPPLTPGSLSSYHHI